MTATVEFPAARVRGDGATTTVPAQRFRWIVASEFTKLRTLRSNVVALFLTMLGTVGVSALVCAEVAAHWKNMQPFEQANTDPTNLALNGWYLTQLVVGVVAVLVITSEFGSGMVRTTFAAAPRRYMVLAAKLLVVVTAVLVTSVACSLAAFLLGQVLLHSTGVATTLGQPGVARAVFGAGLYATAIAVLGLGLGAVVRNTAGGISALFGVLFVPPILAEAFPSSWHNTIQNYSPMNAGAAILNVHQTKGLGPWAGLGVLTIYVLIVLAAGFAVTRTRDT